MWTVQCLFYRDIYRTSNNIYIYKLNKVNYNSDLLEKFYEIYPKVKQVASFLLVKNVPFQKWLDSQL